MPTVWPLLIPLLAALTYVAAVLSLKRSADLGAGVLLSTVVSNLLAAGTFQLLLALGGQWQPLHLWWQPLVVALLFLSGQIWTLFSLQRGDVSIATPVLGLKILLVAALSTALTAQQLSWPLWLAAALSTAGIATLNRSHSPSAHSPWLTTIASAGLAAASFALFDVLVQKWSPAWGVGRLLPLAMGMAGCLSLATVPLLRLSLRKLAPAGRRWLLAGGGLMALQSLLFVTAVGYFGQATAFNVVYSSRGLWSVAAVAVWGHWFQNTEQHLHPSLLRWRFAGAALMFTAIVLVLV